MPAAATRAATPALYTPSPESLRAAHPSRTAPEARIASTSPTRASTEPNSSKSETTTTRVREGTRRRERATRIAPAMSVPPPISTSSSSDKGSSTRPEKSMTSELNARKSTDRHPDCARTAAVSAL